MLQIRSMSKGPAALGTVLLTGALVLLPAAAPAGAATTEDHDLSLSNGRVARHGTEVRVWVSYRCDEGRTAGVGVFLTQNREDGPAAVGGAGSGQRPCTGETETVQLTVDAGKVRFHRGSASAAVALFISAPGTTGVTDQLSQEIRLRPRH